MADLTKQDILAGEHLAIEPVEIKVHQPDGSVEYGTVYVRAIDGYQRALVNATLVQVKNQGRDVEVNSKAIANINSLVAMMALVDKDTGKRWFGRNELTPKDVEDFGHKWGAGTIEAIYNKAEQISGMSNKALEDAEGNSEAAPRNSSISA